MSNLNVDPKNLFGSDLSAVFGPKASRVHISKFTHAEIMDRLSMVPEFLDTECLGEFPTLFEITNFILMLLKRTKALYGIDLDWVDSLKLLGLNRPDDMYKLVSKCAKNNKSQRGIQLRHLIRDILFKFNPKWVQSGLARYSPSMDMFFLNDAQHRFLGCVIMGIREIPLEYEISEFKSVDVQQYSCVNLGSLVASEYDKYRTKVETVRIAKSEGVTITDPDFINAWNVYNILLQRGGRAIEKGGDKAKSLECTGIGNLMKHYEDYGDEIFTRALDINVSVFNKSPIATQNIWGICEYIKIQDAAGVMKGNKIDMDLMIAESIAYRFPDGNKVGFYKEVKGVIDAANSNQVSIPYETKVAAGIDKLCNIVHPSVPWAPVVHNGQNIEKTYLGGFNVMPII